MTIAAGFLCSDGVLVCADTEVTGGLGKYHVAKVRHRKEEGVCEYLLSGAGNTGYVGMAFDVIGQAIYNSRADLLAAKDSDDRSNIFHTKMRGVARRLFKHIRDVYPYDTDKPTLDLILGVRFLFGDGSPQLMHIGQDGSVEWAQEIVCGTGDIVVRSYLSILHTKIMPMELMRPLAMFVIYQAKKVGFSVGGSTHVYTLPSGGVYRLVDEEGLARLTERAMHLCMVDARDPSFSKHVIETMAETLKNDIVQLRGALEGDEESLKRAREMMAAAREQSKQS